VITRQLFETADVLRCMVERLPEPGELVNLCENPSGQLGSAWFWVSPLNNTAVYPMEDGGPMRLRFLAGVSQATHFATELMPVTPGQYATARWMSYGGNTYFRARFSWYNAARTLIGSSVQSGYFAPHPVSAPTTFTFTPQLVPANAEYARLRFDFYGDTAAANPAAGAFRDFAQVTVVDTPSDAGLTVLDYVEPILWVDVLADSTAVRITRGAMDVSTLNVSLVNDDLDPTQSAVLQPGRRVQVQALVAGAWTPLFTGQTLRVGSTYDLLAPPSQRARVTLEAVDAVTVLAQAIEPRHVALVRQIPALLEDRAVPWRVTTANGGHVNVPVFPASEQNATLLTSILRTRDTERALAWIDRRGVLQVHTLDDVPGNPGFTFTEDLYNADLVISYDTERVLNRVSVSALAGTSKTDTGPYDNLRSIRRWGERSATFTVVDGGSFSAANYAAAVLALNSTPTPMVDAITVPVPTTAVLDHVGGLDLYALVKVTNSEPYLDTTVFIAGIEHEITPERWLTTYRFEAPGRTALPTTGG
jgi:hypothetical protein